MNSYKQMDGYKQINSYRAAFDFIKKNNLSIVDALLYIDESVKGGVSGMKITNKTVFGRTLDIDSANVNKILNEYTRLKRENKDDYIDKFIEFVTELIPEESKKLSKHSDEVEAIIKEPRKKHETNVSSDKVIIKEPKKKYESDDEVSSDDEASGTATVNNKTINDEINDNEISVNEISDNEISDNKISDDKINNVGSVDKKDELINYILPKKVGKPKGKVNNESNETMKSRVYDNICQGYMISYKDHPDISYKDYPNITFDEEFKEIDARDDRIVKEISAMVNKVYGNDIGQKYIKYVDNVDKLIHDYKLGEYVNDKVLIKMSSTELKVYQGTSGYVPIEDNEWKDIKNLVNTKVVVSKDMTYYDFFMSPLINSIYMLDQEVVSKIHPKNPLLQFALYSGKTLDDFSNMEAPYSLFDYSNILASIKKNTLAKRGVIAKEVFEYRNGLIHHPKISTIKEDCWLKALTMVDKWKLDTDGDENHKIIIKCWRKVLGSKACYLICMNGLKPNKFFAKFFDMLISDKYSLSLMLGPLFPISWLFTPFMLDGSKFDYGTKVYTSAATISRLFVNNVVKTIEDCDKNLVSYSDLVWCAELFKEDQHQNGIVKLIGMIYASYESPKNNSSVKE